MSIASASLPASSSSSILDDILGVDVAVDEAGGRRRFDTSAVLAPRPTPRDRLRCAVALVGAGLAGLLGGIDILLIVLLETLLRGTATDGFDVPGMGFAAWSTENGLEYGFGPAAAAIVISCTALGVAVGWLIVGARRAKRVASSRA